MTNEEYLKSIDEIRLEYEEICKSKEACINALIKENAELKENNSLFKTITKEHEELRKRIKRLEEVIASWEEYGKHLNKFVDDYEQLKKENKAAKDILHQFLIQNPISDWLIKKAKKILKEVEG